jgi:hypothetical protein
MSNYETVGTAPGEGAAPAGMKYLTGGGTINLATLVSSAQAANYSGLYLDPRYIWTISSASGANALSGV